jgi:large subunit ribosomal protein L25
METTSLKVSQRETLRKKVKALRRSGLIPLNLYGLGMPSRTLQCDSPTVTTAVGKVGHHLPLVLEMPESGTTEVVLVREIQRDPITNSLIHVDFQRIDVSEKTTGNIPVVLIGEAPAIRARGGILNQTTQYLPVECLPMDMPKRIEVDITHLENLGQSIRVAEIDIGPNVTILSDPEDFIVRINAQRTTQKGSEETQGLENSTASSVSPEVTRVGKADEA